MNNLLVADLLNPEKFIHGSINKNYASIRIGRFKLSVHRRYRGGFRWEHHRGHYFNLDVCSRTKHAWWAMCIYLFYNASLRER